MKLLAKCKDNKVKSTLQDIIKKLRKLIRKCKSTYSIEDLKEIEKEVQEEKDRIQALKDAGFKVFEPKVFEPKVFEPKTFNMKKEG